MKVKWHWKYSYDTKNEKPKKEQTEKMVSFCCCIKAEQYLNMSKDKKLEPLNILTNNGHNQRKLEWVRSQDWAELKLETQKE